MPTDVPTHRRPRAPASGARGWVLAFGGVLLVFGTAASIGLGESHGPALVGPGRDRPTASYAGGERGDGAVQTPPPARPPARPGGGGGRVVLEQLDRRRERAWRTGRPQRLAAVFVPGSAVLQRDATRLAAYVRRGLQVSGVTMHYGRIDVVGRHPRQVRLRVVDRLQDATAQLVSTRAVRALPTDRASRHVITLARTRTGWRIAQIVRSRHRPGHRPPRSG